MRIAQIAPLFEAVPPRLYGGTERIVSYLAEGLVRRGHRVTLFASGDSQTSAELVPMRDMAMRLDPALTSDIAAHFSMLDEVRRRQAEFDVIHVHLSHFMHFPFLEEVARKTVTTPHGRLDYRDLGDAYARWPAFPMVSISLNQRLPLPGANWVGNVYHGLPLELCRPPAVPPGQPRYLAFLGRVSPEKRPDRAIEIARRAGMPLRMAAKVDPADRVYFDSRIEPLIGENGVDFVGEVDERGKAGFLAGAEALLFPIDWPEPFGMVMIEAMAFGVPVIAWRNGSVPEIIDDGVTGFVVESLDEAVDAVGRARSLDRAKIRAVFEARFSADRMVGDYEAIYERLAVGAPERLQPHRDSPVLPSGLVADELRMTNGSRVSAIG